jgi:hypothetical protein
LGKVERGGILALARRGHPWPLIFFLTLIALAGWMLYGPDYGNRVEVNANDEPQTAVAPGPTRGPNAKRNLPCPQGETKQAGGC